MGYLTNASSLCAEQESEIISTENGTSHTAFNPKAHTVRHYHIDGDVFPKNVGTLRCDYLVINDHLQKAYFIELSGSVKIGHATQQLDTTVGMLKPELGTYQIFRRLIYSSRTTNIKHSQDYKKVLIWKSKRENVVFKKSPFSETIN